MFIHYGKKELTTIMEETMKMYEKSNIGDSIDKAVEMYFSDGQRREELLIELGKLRAENEKLKEEIKNLNGYRNMVLGSDDFDPDSRIKFGKF